MTSEVVQSDFTEGVLLPNYVNGRLLVAEDLRTGQSTMATRDRWVGQAAGAGIVRGLWVSPGQTTTTLVVQAGLAMSKAGEPVVLNRSVTLDLAPVSPVAGMTPADGSFHCCDGGQTTTQSSQASTASTPATTTATLPTAATTAPMSATTAATTGTAPVLGAKAAALSGAVGLLPNGTGTGRTDLPGPFPFPLPIPIPTLPPSLPLPDPTPAPQPTPDPVPVLPPSLPRPDPFPTPAPKPPPPPSQPPLAREVVLLVARPAAQLQGKAPLTPPPASTAPPTCTAQWVVNGVELRTVVLPISTAVAGRTVTDATLRNLVAHWCLGTEQLAALGSNPFRFDQAYGGLDALGAADLTAYDVPLAVVSWSADGASIGLVDNWSVRRRVTLPDPTPGHWSVEVADRREADGQARWLQFQDQVEDLVVSRTAAGHAGEQFALLPPVGFLPLSSAAVEEMTNEALAQVAAATDQLLTVAAQAAQAAAQGQPPGAAPDPTAPKARAAQAVQAAAAAGGPAIDAEALSMQAAQAGIGSSVISAAISASGISFDAAAIAFVDTNAFNQLVGLQSYLTQAKLIAQRRTVYGYAAPTFFEGMARYGGVIGWDLADFALRQSWRLAPVPVPTQTQNQTLFTYYTVREDPSRVPLPTSTDYLYHYLGTTGVFGTDAFGNKGGFPDPNEPDPIEHVTIAPTTTYVVFVANQLWPASGQGYTQQLPFVTQPWTGTAS